ncbi:hypothetical protein PR003_g24366 [Phytophthora rubi]|nr:hypothetical protein PR001_g23065 [Phytophthora rubi]KAE9294015.1 hypothetical protein PR003_g24366 [Phytophthora rubi]
MHPAGKVFGLQVRKAHKLEGLHKQRSQYFKNKKCAHNRRLRAVPPDAKVPFDLSKVVNNWDGHNFNTHAASTSPDVQRGATSTTPTAPTIPTAPTSTPRRQARWLWGLRALISLLDGTTAHGSD